MTRQDTAALVTGLATSPGGLLGGRGAVAAGAAVAAAVITPGPVRGR